jgi:hypothetical protein
MSRNSEARNCSRCILDRCYMSSDYVSDFSASTLAPHHHVEGGELQSVTSIGRHFNPNDWTRPPAEVELFHVWHDAAIICRLFASCGLPCGQGCAKLTGRFSLSDTAAGRLEPFPSPFFFNSFQHILRSLSPSAIQSTSFVVNTNRA